MTFGRLAGLVGLAILILITNIVISILYMVVYSFLINPGHDDQYYHEHIQIAAPYSSIIAGVFLMFLAGWLVGGWWGRSFAIKAALTIWLTYAVIDLAMVLAVGVTAKEAALVAVSLATKLAAVCFGSLAGAKRHHA